LAIESALGRALRQWSVRPAEFRQLAGNCCALITPGRVPARSTWASTRTSGTG